MKNVNFKELIVESQIDEFETMDVRKTVGNSLYKRASDIPMSDLSRAIYHSDGDLEIKDEDFMAMMEILEQSLVRFINKAIYDAAKNATNKEEERV